MKILAIETSCDETGVAVLEGTKDGDTYHFNTLGASLISQAALHAEYGGVYPTLAKREHEKNLPAVFAHALEKAGMDASATVDAIAVTSGPGLEPALWTGVVFAQELAKKWGVPLIPVNHMEGHLLSSLAQPTESHASVLQNTRTPVLALLISGGHTEFVLMRDWFQYEVVGETKDDAVGEAFDKVARMLELPYPGGPEISKAAHAARENGSVSSVTLPRPMLHTNTCDMSFSGLKTAALYALRDIGGIENVSKEERAAFAREFEDAVTDVLVHKTKLALKHTGAKTFVIGGGVAANTHIRNTLTQLVQKEFPDVELRLPDISITGDNAVMIAMTALARSLAGVQTVSSPESVRAEGNLSISTVK